MFNLSFGEIVLLAIIGLIIIGPKQLPQIAKSLAKTINEFKRAMNDVTNTVTKEIKAESSKPEEVEKEEKNV